MNISYLTTQEEFVDIQISEFKKLYPTKKITKRIINMFENGCFADGNNCLSFVIRDTFENIDLYKDGRTLKQIFAQFTKCYDICPPENKFSLYVGFKYFLTKQEGNYYNGLFEYRNEPFFNECNVLLEQFNSNNKNTYSPFVID